MDALAPEFAASAAAAHRAQARAGSRFADVAPVRTRGGLPVAPHGAARVPKRLDALRRVRRVDGA
jgi:hypothetical protein